MGSSASTIDPSQDIDLDIVLRYLKLVLPVIGGLSERLAGNYEERDKRKGYLRNINSSALVLADSLNEIKDNKSNDIYRDQILQLADCLEGMFVNRPVDLRKPTRSYAMLQFISELSASSQDYLLELETILNISTKNSDKDWNELQRSLNGLSDALRPKGEYIHTSELPGSSTRFRMPEREIFDFLSCASNAILCNCRPNCSRDLGLRVGTYRKRRVGQEFEPLSCTFLARESTSDRYWREVRLQTRTRDNFHAKRDPTPCICEHFKTHTMLEMCLDPTLDEDILHRSALRPTPRLYPFESQKHELNLKDILSSDRRHWKKTLNWVLALTLAYSFLYMHDENRARGRWTQRNIFFFVVGNRIALRPFFRTNSFQREGAHVCHDYPQLLELGVMLLEIHIGEGLESYLKKHDKGYEKRRRSQRVNEDDDLYWKANLVFSIEAEKAGFEKNTSVIYQRVVEACLKPVPFPGQVRDNEQLRFLVFEQVVKLLEREVAVILPQLWNSADLDKAVAETYNLTLSKTSFAYYFLKSLRRTRSCQHSNLHKWPEVVESMTQDGLTGLKKEPHPSQPYVPDHNTLHGPPQSFTATSDSCENSKSLLQPILSDKENVSSRNNFFDQRLEGQAMDLQEAAQSASSRTCNDTFNGRIDRSMIKNLAAAIFFDGKSSVDHKHGDRADDFFLAFESFRKSYIVPKLKILGGQKRIKVAVLDTGIDQEHTAVRGLRDDIIKCRRKDGYSKLDRDPIKRIESFTEIPGDQAALDQCGHGTHVVWLVLETAPDAEIHIAKVSCGETFDDFGAVIRAVDWALEMEVDIITMSFGSSKHDSKLDAAISQAVSRKLHQTLVFAAASNDGINSNRTFPATHPSVIGVHSLTGHGHDIEGLNPSATRYHDDFGTLGQGIQMSWNGESLYKSGSSYAAPVAAGIAVNCLIWLKYMKFENRLDEDQYTWLKTIHGMRHIFREQGVSNGTLRSIAPWNCWSPQRFHEGSDEARVFCDKIDNIALGCFLKPLRDIGY